MTDAKDVTPIIQNLREFVEDGNDGTFGTVAMHGSSVIGGHVSALLAEIDILTRERDEAANLLAVIHGDGGHHTASVGFARSCVDAEAVVLQDRTARNEARSLCDETINLLHDADREADTLRTQLAAARVVTDAMIDKGWSLLRARCVEDYYGSLDLVERDDFAAALTAALTQGDA